MLKPVAMVESPVSLSSGNAADVVDLGEVTLPAVP